MAAGLDRAVSLAIHASARTEFLGSLWGPSALRGVWSALNVIRRLTCKGPYFRFKENQLLSTRIAS